MAGLGDGDTSPDWIISGNSLQLRTERAGNGNGRVYMITIGCSDSSGNMTTKVVKVEVPHDKP